MFKLNDFLREIRAIAAQDLRYRSGGIGKDGTCDCIGLIMGAMYALGREEYPIHSTNYFARYQTLELRAVNSVKDLFPGQVLYRSRTDRGTLNARYKSGGRYYTGDSLDYYHVGVVTRLNPLEITECTEYGDVSGIVITDKLRGWDCGGKLRGVDYSTMDKEDADMPVLYRAKVNTQEDPLTLRNAPISGKKIGELPRGAVVDVYGSGDWPRVKYGDMMGYAAAQYLERVEDEAEPDAPTETQTPEEENIIRVSGDARIVDDAGNVFRPAGGWRVVFGTVD